MQGLSGDNYILNNIYNRLLVEGFVSGLLKSCIVNPLPKVSPLEEIISDLRPITLACTIGKVTRSMFIRQIAEKIDPRQYARQGHSTDVAVIYLLQAIHEATDIICILLQRVFVLLHFY